MSAMDVEIERIKAAMRSRQSRLDALSNEFRPPAHCCPSCASSEFRELAAKQDRACEVLERLLRKCGDVAFAESVRIGAWP